MGVSFKVAKAGTRYRPKLVQVEDKEIENDSTTEPQHTENEGDHAELGDKVSDYSNTLAKPGLHLVSEDSEVSFSLNLFPSGFCIGKPNELLHDVPKQLYPYDSTSETLFCAIESGCLPGDILDDLPCKYVNGALLCEIRDYRNILSQKGETTSPMDTSPVIYKVVLQMCMENVVKDISSISDDSWTYSDLLEFESRILKALRPDLRLDPKPALDRFSKEPPAEKINLGFFWNRKKRKLSDSLATDQVFSIPSPRIPASEVCLPWNLNFQSDVELLVGVPYSGQLIPSSIFTLQSNDIPKENMSQSSGLTSLKNYQLAAATCNQSLSGALMPSSALCASKPNSLTLDERKRCGTLANRPIRKRSKQDRGDFSREQLPESQAETRLALELQSKNKFLFQQIEADRILHERTCEKMHPSPSRENGQQAILEGIMKLQPEVPNFRVKEEPIEISSFQSLNVGNARDRGHMVDMRNDRSYPLQSQLMQSLVKANMPAKAKAKAKQRNHMGKSMGKNITNEAITQGQKGKVLQHSQVSSGAINASVPSCLENSLPREASLLIKRKSNSHLKVSSMNRLESLSRTSAMSTVNTVSLPVGISVPCPSVIDVHESPLPSGTFDPVLDRLLKLQMVNQRYVLNNTKRKISQVFGKKSFSCRDPLVALYLLNLEDKNLKDGKPDMLCHSECTLENDCNNYKTRRFTFVRESHVSQGNDTDNSKAQNKLTIVEKLNEGIVEATIAYNYKYFDPVESCDSCLLETFTNTRHADLFADQFSSLMIREGYRLADDMTEPVPPVIDGGSTSQPQTVTSTVTPAAETVELVPPTPIPEQSPYIFPSQNFFFGGHSFPSALPHSPGYFSKSPLEIASQVSPMHLQWQHIINKRAFLQLQMFQRYQLQQQFLQKRMMMGELDTATGCLNTKQLGGGFQGLGNIGLSPFANAEGMGGCMPLLRGGNIQEIGSSRKNNIPGAVLSRKQIAENGGRTLMSGFSIDGSAGVVPTCPPSLPGVSYHTISQQPPPTRMQQQLYMQQHQEMKSPLYPLEARTEHVGSPPSPSGLIHVEQQQLKMSSQQISSALVPQQMESGNVVGEYGSPGLGSQTPGSAGSWHSCCTSSSMELHGLNESGNATQTGGG